MNKWTVLLLGTTLIVLGALWWRAMAPPVPGIPLQHDPVSETIRVTIKPDSLEWNQFVVTMKNGDTFTVEGTHYVSDGTYLFVKDASRNVAVWTCRQDAFATITRKRIMVGRQDPLHPNRRPPDRD